MSFLHRSAYPYGTHAGIPMDHGHPIAHPAMANAMDAYLLTHSPYEMTDYYAHMPMMEDYEEYAENLSRPRLTKEQVDTLEAQFQAHPKPNSNVKRQLALQTNLSLPRVANWFQNRRAKAKQQRRQEEFERMQREAKEKDGQAKVRDEESTDGQSERGQKSPARKNDGNNSPNRKSLTPTQASSNNNDRSQNSDASSVSRHKHHKTGSDITREKTFASLQRALDAAVAARDHHTRATEGSISAGTVDIGFDVPQTNMSASNTPQNSINSAYSEWGSSRDSSIAWTPSQSPEDGFEFGSLNAVPFASEDQLTVAHMDNSPSADLTGSHGFGGMNPRTQQLWSAQLQGRPDVHSSESMYGPFSLQPPSASSSRRASACEELAETVNGIGIHNTSLSSTMEGPMWRRPEKELDLAARRKRPRPAAIGTAAAHHRLVAGPSAVSPNTRMPSFGAPHHHTLRHAKSSHTLGSRYAGVRKFSAPQRSPLGFANFADAASGASEHKQKHRLQTSASLGNLAPPTPLTPEDFQHMLPATTSDSQLNLASQRLADNQGLFPVTQPMQINVASPPETPLTMDMFSTIQYQGLAPPLSAPPQYASFTEYSPLSSEPMTAVSWAVSTPDTSVFPGSVQSQRQQQQQPPPNYIYEQDDEQREAKWSLSEEGSSLYGSTKASATPPASMMTGSEEQDQNMKFHIHEFPEQQEAHRNVAQQLAPQIPKNYTFSNQTPSDF
ncbi:hypothetical protein UA08_04491 [Talaromyces atroroseus]|uniref:Homeobox domain-containing protein n=1 Tax=Talaromyces atroroseus TaxID=1441469 RepID=A0A225AS39_TALAT|nr:hypothetical protein UA08_04491 [Talaromyces atroroseus]OKL60098.1 hypothetical protein UA08_04491 [Talaromyces atroroseus]